MIDRSTERWLAPRGALSLSFSAFRGSLCAALGLSLVACGGNVGSGGNAGSGGSGGSGGGGAGGGSVLAPCTGEKPILQPSGADSGYVLCDDGRINRAFDAVCDILLVDSCEGTETTLQCMTGADCTAKANGTCQSFSYQGPTLETGCACAYECEGDAQCAAGEACVCAGVTGASASFCASPGDCLGPADCASGECGLARYDDGCGEARYAFCRDGDDACQVPADCEGAEQCAKTDATGTWKCLDVTCTIGRPLLVDGGLRFAPPSPRGDWSAEAVRPETGSLSGEVRSALAAHFTAMAAMEHASIGSFARFTLELLAAGAPPDLLLATQEAAIDEIAHARLCYALASAYSGSPIGPGPLCVAGVVPETSAASILAALVREACVGETAAAAEALGLASMVEDPVLAGVYARIAEDEARHSELGWRALSWLLSGHPELVDVAREAFASSTASIGPEPLVAGAVVAPEHGLLAPASLAALRAKAIAEIVEPCARALLSSVVATRAPELAVHRRGDGAAPRS